MKTTKTYTEEVIVCDICGKEEDFTIRRHIRICASCGKDVCTDDSYLIRGQRVQDEGTMAFVICKNHISLENVSVENTEILP